MLIINMTNYNESFGENAFHELKYSLYRAPTSNYHARVWSDFKDYYTH